MYRFQLKNINFQLFNYMIQRQINFQQFNYLIQRRIQGGGGGGYRVPDPLENHKWLYVSIEILVRTPLGNQLDPASPGWSVPYSVKYNDD